MTDDTIVPDGYKRCTKCGAVKRETREFFVPDPRYHNGLSSWCRTCKNEYDRNRPKKDRSAWSREYYLRVRDERREMWREKDKHYRDTHRDEIRDRNRHYQQTHREKVSEWGRRSRAKHADVQLAKARRWQRNNPDKIKRIRKNYVNRHPEVAHMARLRRRKDAASKRQVAVLLKKSKGKCYYCGKKIEGTPHIDHAVPIARGGSNDIGNLVVTCAFCNLSKGKKLPHEFSNRLL